MEVQLLPGPPFTARWYHAHMRNWVAWAVILGAVSLFVGCQLMEAMTEVASDPVVQEAGKKAANDALTGDWIGFLGSGGRFVAEVVAAWRLTEWNRDRKRRRRNEETKVPKKVRAG